MHPRTVRWVTRTLAIISISLIAPSRPARAQYSGARNDPVHQRALRDLEGQSHTEIGPRGRGYSTPMHLPGIDDFNGPSRAYSPIFNAPQAAPSAAGPPRARPVGTRPGLLRRVFRR